MAPGSYQLGPWSLAGEGAAMESPAGACSAVPKGPATAGVSVFRHRICGSGGCCAGHEGVSQACRLALAAVRKRRRQDKDTGELRRGVFQKQMMIIIIIITVTLIVSSLKLWRIRHGNY